MAGHKKQQQERGPALDVKAMQELMREQVHPRDPTLAVGSSLPQFAYTMSLADAPQSISYSAANVGGVR